MERYCCNVICGAPTTSEVKGLRSDDVINVYCPISCILYAFISCKEYTNAVNHTGNITIGCEQKSNSFHRKSTEKSDGSSRTDKVGIW